MNTGVKIAVVIAAFTAAASAGIALAANTKILRAPITEGILKVAPPTAPHYVFTLNSFTINDTRSRHNDTDYVGAAVSGQKTVFKSMGDVNNGLHEVGMSFTATVSSDQTVEFKYTIVNQGSGVVTGMEDAVGGMLGFFSLPNFAFANCDGVVAAQKRSFTGAQLAAQTSGGHTINFHDKNVGTDSPTGCGSNSLYYVDWSVRAVN